MPAALWRAYCLMEHNAYRCWTDQTLTMYVELILEICKMLSIVLLLGFFVHIFLTVFIVKWHSEWKAKEECHCAGKHVSRVHLTINAPNLVIFMLFINCISSFPLSDYKQPPSSFPLPSFFPVPLWLWSAVISCSLICRLRGAWTVLSLEFSHDMAVGGEGLVGKER